MAMVVEVASGGAIPELDQLISKASSGEDVVLTQGGEPIARLTSVELLPKPLSGPEFKKHLDYLRACVAADSEYESLPWEDFEVAILL